MDEQVYLQGDGVRVTSTRVEIGSEVYAVRNISSVRVQSGNRPWLGALFLMIAFAAYAASSPILGTCLMVIGAYATWQKVVVQKLMLGTSGGEQVALSTAKRRDIEALRSAIAQAIAVR